MSKRDQMNLEDIYSRRVLNENIKEPDFVKNPPHPIDPPEGAVGVNKLIKQEKNQAEQYDKAAKMMLDRELKKHDVNFAVLKRDNFGNVNFDSYNEAVTKLVTYMQHHKDNVDLINATVVNLAKNLASQIEQVSNRYDYNPDMESSNIAAMNNANATSPQTQSMYHSESTINYLSASFDKKPLVLSENQNTPTQAPKINSTLSYLGKGK